MLKLIVCLAGASLSLAAAGATMIVADVTHAAGAQIA